MEVNNAAHYNNNYHQAHAALVNLALNNPLNPQGGGRLSTPLVNDYTRSPAVYGLSTGLLPGQQGSPLVSHATHQNTALYNNSPGQAGLDAYGNSSPALSSGGTGYQSLGPYGNGLQSVFNNNMGSSDPYQQQRGAFHY
jgi:hypothetical protein